jgi:hypothetical protein
MGFVRIITIAVSVLLLGMPLCTRADTPSNALIVVAEGDGVSQEFANDVTEALIFSLSRNNNQQFLPKDHRHCTSPVQNHSDARGRPARFRQSGVGKERIESKRTDFKVSVLGSRGE